MKLPPKFAALATAVAFTASATAPPVHAACVLTTDAADSIVRGQFIRCDDAAFYLQASGAYQYYEEDLENAIERVGESNRGELMQRLLETPLLPLHPDFDARVIVIATDLRATIAPWRPGSSTTVELRGEPQEVRETSRYWWQGSIDACDNLAPSSTVVLRVYAERCDTYEFPAPVCIVQMNSAEFATPGMTAALSLD